MPLAIYHMLKAKFIMDTYSDKSELEDKCAKRTITTKTKPFIPKWKLLLRKNPLKQSIKVLGMVGVSVHQSILRRVLRVSLKA